MLKTFVFLFASIFALAAIAAELQPDWRELALQAQKNATLEQMTANGMIVALRDEIAQLKAQLSALQHNSSGQSAPPSGQ